MKKAELKELSTRYGMSIMREEITNEGIGLYLMTEKDIPELDALANIPPFSAGPRRVIATKAYNPWDNSHTYRVYCPTSWFDLWGWAD